MKQYDNIERAASREAAESRFARRIVACLNESAHDVPHGVGERLQFARDKALQAAVAVRSANAAHGVGLTASGVAVLGLSGSPWWLRIASFLPLVALVGGLVLIQEQQLNAQISVAAEVDEALLGDDLPINAYRDPGFSEFLKTSPNE